MLPSQLWLLLDTAVLPGLALAHWSTQGWPEAHVSGSSSPFPLAPQALAPCVAHQQVCVPPHLKGAVSAATGGEKGVFSLACMLLSPECLHEVRLLLGLSQRVAMDFYLLGLADTKTMWEVLCCCMIPGELQRS